MLLALRRLTPRESSESVLPGHQGAGSKSASVALPATRQGALSVLRVARAESVALAPSRVASAERNSITRSLPRASMCNRAIRGAACGRRWSSSGPDRSATSATARASAFVAAKPVPTSAALPLSEVCGARASSAAGCTLSRSTSVVQRSAVQRPRAVMRPPSSFAEPSSANSVCRSSVLRSSGRPCSSARSWRTGSRPSFQRPARSLRSSIETIAGRSMPLVASVAWPLSDVAGAALEKAPRSSALVDARSSPSGQAAKGLTRARASSDCAGCAVDGDTRAVALTARASSGPAAATSACQGGTAFAEARASFASSVKGGSAAIATRPVASALS